MTRARRSVATVLLAACAALLTAAPAHAAPPAATPDTGTASSSRTSIVDLASLDAQFESVRRARPGATVDAEYSPATRAWTVRMRQPGDSLDLARFVVDDRTHAITGRFRLPGDQYPPRMRVRDVERRAHTDRRAREEVRRRGGFAHMSIDASYVGGDVWEVNVRRSSGSVAVRVDVDDRSGAVTGVWTGAQIAWKMARGVPGAFGDHVNDWWIWWPLFALFAVVMVDWRDVRSWRTLDAVALLAFGVSHAYFNHGRIDWSVPLAYPPLAYLFVRMSLLFVRGVPDARPRATATRAWMVVPTWALVALALFAAGVRYGVDGWGSNVIDVGYAGVAGAHDILDGKTPYGNMPSDNANGDTYGPLDYLAYVPAVAVFGERSWDTGLPAAHAVSIASDLLCALALVLVGWRWISRRAAALLVAGWMLYPYTAFALCNNVNDLLVAALLLLAFAALPRAWLRGGLVAMAAAVKFVPLVALAPIAHCGARNRVRQATLAALSTAVVAAASYAFVTHYPAGWHRFVHATFDFQYDRDSPFSIWGMYHWRRAQQVAQGIFALLLLAALFVPRARDYRQVSAGMAAALLGAQLVLQHWFYLYIPWFCGFVLVTLVAARDASPPAGAHAAAASRAD